MLQFVLTYMLYAPVQIYLAGMHYSLSVLRRHGWGPWRSAMDAVKAARWRASECRRRRLLASALAAWWSPVEEALAAQWRVAAVATRFHQVSSHHA